MDTLKYILSQSIGIYYKDFDWASKLFDKIVEHYPKEYFIPHGIINNKSRLELIFKDGTIINFIRAIESSRGRCFSKVIVQSGIDEEIIRSVIYYTLKHQNRNIMILQDENSVSFFKR